MSWISSSSVNFPPLHTTAAACLQPPPALGTQLLGPRALARVPLLALGGPVDLPPRQARSTPVERMR